MDETLLSALNESQRRLVAETSPAALRGLDEDAVLDLHSRVRRARNTSVNQYRRRMSARARRRGSGSRALFATQQAAQRAQALEDALAEVSRRLTVLARQAARELEEERLSALNTGAAAAQEMLRSGGDRSLVDDVSPDAAPQAG